MTTRSLEPYLRLIALGKGSALACELDVELAADLIEALLTARLLEEGPHSKTYPCPQARGSCARVVIQYKGPENFDYLAVPPQRNACCDHLNLTCDQVRTYLAEEFWLVRKCCEWLGMDACPAEKLHALLPIQHIGAVSGHAGNVPVFFARRLHTRAGRDMLLEFAALGPCIVVVPLRDGLTAEFEQRCAKMGPIHFIVLSDVLTVEDGDVVIAAAHPFEGPKSGVRTIPADDKFVCRLLTLQGERPITAQELEAQRAERSQRDLFVDFTTSVKGGIPCWVRDPADHQLVKTTVLKPLEGKILLEYVRASGRPIAPKRLRCVRDGGILTAMRMVRDLRAKIDKKYSRDHYGLFHSCKGASNGVEEYFFKPADGYSMAILLPLDRDDAQPAPAAPGKRELG